MVALIFSATMMSNSPADTFMSAGLSYMNQDYREFNRSGRLIDSDKGSLIGPRIYVQWRSATNLLSLTHKDINGKLAYDSISATSYVDARERDTQLLAQHRLRHAEQYSLFGTAGIGIKKRGRNIAGTTSLSGLDETYRHKYGTIGLMLEYRVTSIYSLYARVNYQKDFHSELEAAFTAQLFDPIKFPISKSSHQNLQFELQRKLEDQWVIAINVSKTMAKSTRSNRFTLRKNGNATTKSVSEPASETRSLSTFITLGRTF